MTDFFIYRKKEYFFFLLFSIRIEKNRINSSKKETRRKYKKKIHPWGLLKRSDVYFTNKV